MIHNTQGTHYKKVLYLFLEHFLCFQLAMENNKKPQNKNKQKPNKQTHTHKKTPQQYKHLLNDSPSHGTITQGSDLLQPQANNIAQRCIYDLQIRK